MFIEEYAYMNAHIKKSIKNQERSQEKAKQKEFGGRGKTMSLDKLMLLRILILISAVCILLAVILYRKYRKYGVPIWSIIPIIGESYYKKKVKSEIKTAESGIKYLEPGKDDPDGKKFQAFLRDLPTYCIEDGFVARQIRGLMRMAGAEYRQVVLINKADISDKKIWVRKTGQLFIHSKGTYFIPWESVKDVLYYDIIDGRPLIDQTDEMQWYNPEMCAEVITAVTNTNAMKSLGEDSLKNISQYLIYVIILLVIVGILTGYSIYIQGENTKHMTTILTNISQRL